MIGGWLHTRNLRRFGIFLIAVIGYVSPNRLAAQKQGASAIRIDVNLVMIDVTVKNKASQIMADLKQDDFEVREDGVLEKLAVFGRNQFPLNVTLVLDVSTSIRPFLGPLHDAAISALSALKPEDEVALFTFSTKAQLVVPFTTDKIRIADTIKGLYTGGLTNMNDGLFDAAEYFLEEKPKGRHVVILISDDVGTLAGRKRTGNIVTEMLEADATLYNLMVPGYNPGGGLVWRVVDLHKVMDETGGEIFYLNGKTPSLDSAFGAMIERIKTRYTLGYYTSANRTKSRFHRLDIRLDSSFGKKGRDYIVLGKKGFFSPGFRSSAPAQGK